MIFNAKKCYMLSLRKKIQGSCKLDGHTLEQVPSNPYKYKKILNGRNTLTTLLKKPVPPWASKEGIYNSVRENVEKQPTSHWSGQ
jgi:hypothetical protein